MTGRVLVGFDDSEGSRRALEYALAEHADAAITALYVIDPIGPGYGALGGGPGYAEGWYEAARERARDLLEEATALAEERGVDIDTATAVGRPASAIVKHATEHGVDHVVTGSHGREGVSRILLGSVAETVVRRSPVPVTVVR
jgi:nucleotide-binding universal stress UspA family protein